MTLKAIHLIDENVYLIKNDSRLTLEVSGLRVNSNSFTVKSLDEIFMWRKLSPKTLHYSDGQNILSIEEYNTKRSELLKNAEYDSYQEECSFSTLEEEYAYKKFLQTWKMIYDDPQPERIPVEVEIVEVRTISGDPDIDSLWNSPNIITENKFYCIDRDKFSKKYLTAYCQQNNLNFNIPDHSGIVYAQINGKYAFNSDFLFKNTNFIGTLEQCKQEKERLDKKIKSVVYTYVSIEKETKPKDIGSIIQALKILNHDLKKIKPVSTSRYNYITFSDKLNLLITNLEEEVYLNSEKP